MKKSICSFFFFVLLASISALSTADVKVVINDTQYIYQQNPRLSDVLLPVAFKQQWYWPNAKLYKEQSVSLNKMRNDTIFAVSNYEKVEDIDLSTMIAQIESWQLAQRIKIPINFERARFSLDKNPQFENGGYFLQLGGRAKQIHFFGALLQEQRLDYQDNACITDYLVQIKKIKAAEKSFVYILPNYANENDRHAIKAPVAYWNKQCVVPMPGSSIYVPLQENQIFKESARINHQVISLAQNRVVAL